MGNCLVFICPGSCYCLVGPLVSSRAGFIGFFPFVVAVLEILRVVELAHLPILLTRNYTLSLWCLHLSSSGLHSVVLLLCILVLVSQVAGVLLLMVHGCRGCWGLPPGYRACTPWFGKKTFQMMCRAKGVVLFISHWYQEYPRLPWQCLGASKIRCGGARRHPELHLWCSENRVVPGIGSQLASCQEHALSSLLFSALFFTVVLVWVAHSISSCEPEISHSGDSEQ